jgi:hypothetical protein
MNTRFFIKTVDPKPITIRDIGNNELFCFDGELYLKLDDSLVVNLETKLHSRDFPMSRAVRPVMAVTFTVENW